MTDERRRSPRLLAGWHGRYTLDDRADGGWYECRIIDVSLGGASVELFGPAPREGAGLHLELAEVVLRETSAFPARARHLGRSVNTGVRVGIEWHKLTRHQAALLNSFLKLTYDRAS